MTDAQSSLKKYREKIVHGIYRHFKGNLYEVLHVALHSETLEPMVVYRALYGDRDVWVRPASMWNEEVDYEGETVRRFSYVGQKTTEAEE
ncbi:MAG: DUF1653 domain-containing protein [Oscillospiraceae bacterium]|nr:DUF1653 domain-containing protein [Oscillospiraceae bacterium]